MAIADYLAKLVEMKNQLVANLNSMGVMADESEKLNALIPKMLEIKGKQNVEFVEETDFTGTSGSSGNISGVLRAISKIIIPDGTTSIGKYAFLNCSNLESITIPDSVTSIGDYAFSGCASLELILSNTITTIKPHAFSGMLLVCPQAGVDTSYAPWDTSSIHRFDENGICQNCGRAVPIIFYERTTANFTKKPDFEIFTDKGREYSYIAKSTNGVSDDMPFKVFDKLSLTISMTLSNCKSSSYIYFIIYKKNENDIYEEFTTKQLTSSGSTITKSYENELEQGEYKLYIYFKPTGGTLSSYGASYYIPETLMY